MPVHIAFLGCGFITGVHGRHLKALRDDVVRSYASYTAAIEDPAVDAVVVAVPPRFHLDLTLQALSGRQTRAGGEAGLPPDGGLPAGAISP